MTVLKVQVVQEDQIVVQAAVVPEVQVKELTEAQVAQVQAETVVLVQQIQ
jgi:hypothetical protein